MRYQVQAQQTPGNNFHMVIIGLPGLDHSESFENPTPTADTTLWAMDGDYSSADGIMKALYGALYDEYQTNEAIKAGDTFCFETQSVNARMSYDPKYGTVELPSAEFKAEGVHILKV